MIATWMVYTVLVSALLAIAAVALERAALVLRIPMRFIWLASVIASVAWPIANAAQRIMAPAKPVLLMPFTISLEATRVIAEGPSGADRAIFLDRTLITLWILVSFILLVRLGQAVVALQRTRSQWRATDVDGTTVRLSPNVGPAVVGLRSMDVVLPEWIMSLDAPLRALVLRHEEEHRTARDPYLLLIAAIAAAIMPWNLALWLQARRLRLAIEVDCDARVLRAHPSPERYGLLMLTIAQRRAVAPPMFAPMLSEPTSQLERRIIAMRTSTRRLARVTAIGGTAIATGVLLFACALQSDNPVAPKPLMPRPTRVTDGQTFFEFQVERPVSPLADNARPRYPTALRTANVEGEVLAQFVVDTTGRADMSSFKVLKSTHELFMSSVKSVLPNMLFHPAEVGGRKVKQLVQMPFQFNLSHEATVGAPKGVSATPRAGVVQPRYPDALRAAKIEGAVLAQFVVDERGNVDLPTLKVLKSTDPQFTDAVREALPRMQFNPAVVGNKAVRQLIQMPFTFNLSK